MKPKLLIVDDDLEVRGVLVDTLAALDVEIFVAGNGQEGLDMLEKHEISAVLSDINMPIMNGLEFLEKVRLRGLDTPFVVLSAYGDKVNTVHALRLGAMDFLEKPMDMKTLMDVVHKAVQLGEHIKKLDHELLNYSGDQKLTEEQIKKIREAKKRILLMRFESSGKD